MMKDRNNNGFADHRISYRERLRRLLSGFLAVTTAVAMLGGNAGMVFAEEPAAETAIADYSVVDDTVEEMIGADESSTGNAAAEERRGQDITVHFGNGEAQDISIHVKPEVEAEEDTVLSPIVLGTETEAETEASEETEAETEEKTEI